MTGYRASLLALALLLALTPWLSGEDDPEPSSGKLKVLSQPDDAAK